MPPRPPSPPPDPAQAWVEEGVATLIDLWRRRGAAYGRRLQRAGRLRDPVADVLALGARHLLPLPAPVRRLLPLEVGDPRAVAFRALPAVDRRLLWGLGPAGEDDRTLDLHRAAALARLARNVQAARRGTDAPPGARGPVPRPASGRDRRARD